MDAWIGLIGAVAGTAIGGSIAVYMNFLEQKRKPTLLMLEKRMSVHSELYALIYEILWGIDNKWPLEVMVTLIDKYRSTAMSQLLYIDPMLRSKIIDAHNDLQKLLKGEGIVQKDLVKVLNAAFGSLVDYTDKMYKW